MQYQIQGQPYPVAVLTLQPEESVLCQKGAMSWMTPNMEMATKGGGLGKMFSRALTGEAMFQNQYTAKGGTGMIAFSSALPGEIMPVAITPERPIVAQKSAFLASEAGVSFELYFQKKIAGGFFGGEGFIMQKFSGNGMLFLEIDGSTMAYDLAAGQSLLVDTGNLAAMEATCAPLTCRRSRASATSCWAARGCSTPGSPAPDASGSRPCPSPTWRALWHGSCRRRSNGSSPQISRKNTTAAPEDFPFRCGCFYRSCIPYLSLSIYFQQPLR